MRLPQGPAAARKHCVTLAAGAVRLLSVAMSMPQQEHHQGTARAPLGPDNDVHPWAKQAGIAKVKPFCGLSCS